MYKNKNTQQVITDEEYKASATKLKEECLIPNGWLYKSITENAYLSFINDWEYVVTK